MTSLVPRRIRSSLEEVLNKFDGTKSINDPYSLYGMLITEFGETDENVFNLTNKAKHREASCVYQFDNKPPMGVRLIYRDNRSELEIVMNGKRTVVAAYDNSGNDMLAE